MQYDKKYIGVEAYKAITLPPNEADAIAKGEIDHLVRKSGTPYRGEVILTTNPRPVGERSGMIVGRATITDVKRVANGFLWQFSDARRMIEFPAQQVGAKKVVWDLYYTEDTLMDYPLIKLRNFYE